MALSNQTKRRMVLALADKDAANEVLGSLGVYGAWHDELCIFITTS